MLEAIRATIRELLAKRAGHETDIDKVIAAAEGRGDGSLTGGEERSFRDAKHAIKTLDAELASARVREADLLAEQATRDEAAKLRAQYPPLKGGRGASAFGELHGAGGYAGGGFIRDAVARKFGNDPAAEARLAEHQSQSQSWEQRAVGTGAFAGLSVPQYLLEEFAPLARASAPFLSAVRRLNLPEQGMTVEVGRLTTGTTVEAQTAEGAAVSETNADDTLLSVPVRTYAGAQDISRQAVDRAGVDEIIFGDLAADYLRKVDAGAISGTGANGQHLGLLNVAGIGSVAYTDASPTVGEVWPKIAQAASTVATNRFLAADVLLMHPRRWAWFTAALDSTGRPLVSPEANGPHNAAGIAAAPAAEGFVGKIQGLNVIADAGVPINLGAGVNEDVIIVLRSQDAILWTEDSDLMPRQLRVDEPAATATLQVRLVAYGYSAFTAGRYPSAICTVGGSGLVTPTF